MRRRILTPLLLMTAAMGQADVTRPPSGVDVDETRVVALRRDMPLPCVSVVVDGATVMLSRADLEAAEAARPTEMRTDAERMARVRSGRAAALLSAVSPPKGPGACAEVAGTALDSQGQQLLLDWIENGRAMVRLQAMGEALSTVRVRYLGQRCGPMCGRGDITVSLPQGTRPFLAVSWWVS